MNRTALVTGANRGIGLAIAEQLAQSGIPVLLGSRDLQAGEAAAARLQEKGLAARAVQLDVSDAASIEALAHQTPEVDILVNNAGVLDDEPLLELSDELVERSIAVHLTGPFRLIRLFAPSMINRGYGRIVNLSSNWGSFSEGMGGPGFYGVTKAALNALTVRLAKELPSSVKVNAMCPGWVRTRMGGPSAARSPEEAADTALWLATLPDDGPTGGFFRDRKPLGW